MIMKTFSEYYKEQEIKEFSQWLESQGYDPQTLDLESLLEAGAWEKAKKWGKNAVIAGTLLGVGAGIGGKFTGQQDAPQPNSGKVQTSQKDNFKQQSVISKTLQNKLDRNEIRKQELKNAGGSLTRTNGKVSNQVLKVKSNANNFFARSHNR